MGSSLLGFFAGMGVLHRKRLRPGLLRERLYGRFVLT